MITGWEVVMLGASIIGVFIVAPDAAVMAAD